VRADDKATFEKVCGNCHAASMVSDLKSMDEWTETVSNMASIGAKATDAEFEAVRRYLTRNFTKVNVNAAQTDEIAQVMDIAESAAQAIVDYRTAHGNFSSVEELKKVAGISAAKIDALKERLALR
jgi:competence protein ComEA